MASKTLKLKINKGDNVTVISGSGKGHSGTVLELNTRKLKVKVSGHNMQTHFDKENGIFTKEGYVDYSNIKLEAPSKRKKTTTKKKTTKA